MSDLKEYIKNMKSIEKEASIKDERGLMMMASFAVKTAEEFLEKQKQPSFNSDEFALRQCVNHNDGVFPSQLRESGVMFWDGSRITIEAFKKECRRQGYKFKVA